MQALKVIKCPENLSVGADYGLLVRDRAPYEAWRLAMYILSPQGQKILSEYGFEAIAIRKKKSNAWRGVMTGRLWVPSVRAPLALVFWQSRWQDFLTICNLP
jgi:hypothetical protein